MTNTRVAQGFHVDSKSLPSCPLHVFDKHQFSITFRYSEGYFFENKELKSNFRAIRDLLHDRKLFKEKMRGKVFNCRFVGSALEAYV